MNCRIFRCFSINFIWNITNDDKRQTDAVFTVEELNKLGDIGDVLREFLEEQVKNISRNLISEDPDATIENVWKILSPFVTLEGTKEPTSRKSIQERLSGIDAELIYKIIDAFVNRRILRKSEKEDGNMYEIAHDSLAQRIAEKRTTEENALLEIVRIIKSQAALKGDARELFTERQLNYIEPFLEKLREQKLIDEEGEELIIQSKEKIERDKGGAIAQQEKELRLAKEQAQKETELRKEAEISKDDAVRFGNRAKKWTRVAAVVAIVAIIIAVVALNFYKKANEASAEIEKKNKETQTALKNIKMEHAISKAKELLSYGYSYDNLKEGSLARLSYYAALDTLFSDTINDYSQNELFNLLRDSLHLNSIQLDSLKFNILKVNKLKSDSIK